MIEAINIPLYPFIKVQLLGEDGNAFGILGRCKAAIHKSFLDCHITQQEADDIKYAFMNDSMSGDYDHLLQTVMTYFETS